MTSGSGVVHVVAIAVVVLATPTLGAEAAMKTIQGTLTVAADLADRIGPDDRLVIKIYHPKDGVELDAKYQIVEHFTLPYAFTAAPSIDMNARTKFQAYVVELFTDKDGDVLGAVPGELMARSEDAVPLGTQDLRLELNKPRE